ncbi:unnamed protein product [Caenorhabditis angaria]|uniref:Sulfotransferase domain-containing protein n=1 Tax=Caenorhabditis angaria TaxID=860376 RepID=A0A9P1N3Y7_9PELO|nr:unnamed protein product [Caenorhabditis angaria]
MTLPKLFLVIFLAICIFLYIQKNFSKPDEPKKPANPPLPDLEFILPYLGKFHGEYMTVPEYNLTACSIRKSMSQMATNTMCLLYEPEKFLGGNHSLGETWMNHRVCNGVEKDGLGNFPSEYRNTSYYTRYVFIRDPFDRFISFYLDKCVNERKCYNCAAEDMHCVVQKMYENLLKISKGQKEMISWMNNDSYTDMHVTPASWCCEFHKYLKTYYIMVIGADLEARKEPISKLSDILRRKNVPENYISKIKTDLLTSETLHSTHSSKLRKIAEEKVRNDKIIREYLHKIYFYDYLVFPEFDRAHLDPPYNMSNSRFDEEYRRDYRDIIELQEALKILKN